MCQLRYRLKRTADNPERMGIWRAEGANVARCQCSSGYYEGKGLGKVRHIEVNQLWIQEKVRNKEVEVVKVKGLDNLADALTKSLDLDSIRKHIKDASCYIGSGRHELMPEVVGEVEEVRFMEGKAMRNKVG